MTWGSVADFFAMGGYAQYVWGAYAVTAAVIVVECVLLGARSRTARRRLGKGSPLRDEPRLGAN
jgi:heme exporter protein D